MKKLPALLSLFVFTFAVSTAIAADGEGLYKKSCAGCHGEKGEKDNRGKEPLKDQDADTILKKLQGYADGSYGGMQKDVMANVVKKHSSEELKAVAEHIGKK